MIVLRYGVGFVLCVVAIALLTDLLRTLHDIRNELRAARQKREAEEQLLKPSLLYRQRTKADWAVLDRERPDFFKS